MLKQIVYIEVSVNNRKAITLFRKFSVKQTNKNYFLLIGGEVFLSLPPHFYQGQAQQKTSIPCRLFPIVDNSCSIGRKMRNPSVFHQGN